MYAYVCLGFTANSFIVLRHRNTGVIRFRTNENAAVVNNEDVNFIY